MILQPFAILLWIAPIALVAENCRDNVAIVGRDVEKVNAGVLNAIFSNTGVTTNGGRYVFSRDNRDPVTGIITTLFLYSVEFEFIDYWMVGDDYTDTIYYAYCQSSSTHPIDAICDWIVVADNDGGQGTDYNINAQEFCVDDLCNAEVMFLHSDIMGDSLNQVYIRQSGFYQGRPYYKNGGNYIYVYANNNWTIGSLGDEFGYATVEDVALTPDQILNTWDVDGETDYITYVASNCSFGDSVEVATGLNMLTIILVAVGGVTGLCLICISCYCCVRASRKRKERAEFSKNKVYAVQPQDQTPSSAQYNLMQEEKKVQHVPVQSGIVGGATTAGVGAQGVGAVGVGAQGVGAQGFYQPQDAAQKVFMSQEYAAGSEPPPPEYTEPPPPEYTPPPNYQLEGVEMDIGSSIGDKFTKQVDIVQPGIDPIGAQYENPPSMNPAAMSPEQPGASSPPENPPGADFLYSDGNDGPSSGLGCWAGWKNSPHLKATIATGLMIMMFSFLGFCEANYPPYYCNSWDYYDLHDCPGVCDFYATPAGFWIVWTICFLLYWIEVFTSSSRRYLSNAEVKETVYQYINRLKGTPPVLSWHVQCYHYETRTVSYTDSNGNTQYRTETYRVNTWSNSTTYNYRTWRDTSGKPDGFDQFRLTQIKYAKSYTFGNEETRHNYNLLQAQFKRDNDRDVHQDFSETLSITDFESRMLQELEPGMKPEHLNLTTFLIASLFFMTVPYRIWFSSICGPAKYQFVKEISM